MAEFRYGDDEFGGTFSYSVGVAASYPRTMGGNDAGVTVVRDNLGKTTYSASFGYLRGEYTSDPTKSAVEVLGGFGRNFTIRTPNNDTLAAKFSALTGAGQLDGAPAYVTKLSFKFEATPNLNFGGLPVGPTLQIGGSLIIRTPTEVDLPASLREPAILSVSVRPGNTMPTIRQSPNPDYSVIDDPDAGFGPPRPTPDLIQRTVAVRLGQMEPGQRLQAEDQINRAGKNGYSPVEIATAVYSKNPGQLSFQASGRPQADNPYGPGANQVGPSNLTAKDVYKTISSRPDYVPRTQEDSFANRGGPTGPNSRPHNPLTDPTNTELRHVGGGNNAPATKSGTVLGGNSGSAAIADRGTGVPSYLQPVSGGSSKRNSVTPGSHPNVQTHNPSKSSGGHHPNVQTHNPSKSSSAGSSGQTKSNNDPSHTHGTGRGGPRPILLDLDGDGVEVTQLSQSTAFMDAMDDGLWHRTAWAGAGDGVLFFDANNDGLITEKREYVFTEWDPTATSDLKALRAAFDSNGDGKLTAADAAFAQFKVMVTNADGSTTAKALTELGITEIDLTGDTTLITLPDGSKITAKTTFTRADGSKGTVADTVLAAEAQGYRIEKTVSIDASGNRVLILKAYDKAGALALSITNTTSPDGSTITNAYDDNDDQVTDRIQTITTTLNANGSRTETLINKIGNDQATAVTVNRTITTTSSDGKSVLIERDSTGGGWIDQRETRVESADKSQLNITTNLSKNGTMISEYRETVTADGLTRIEQYNEDGKGLYDTAIQQTVNKIKMVNRWRRARWQSWSGSRNDARHRLAA